jgi:hypothetical protein
MTTPLEPDPTGDAVAEGERLILEMEALAEKLRDREHFEDLARGLAELARRFRDHLAGGDDDDFARTFGRG